MSDHVSDRDGKDDGSEDGEGTSNKGHKDKTSHPNRDSSNDKEKPNQDQKDESRKEVLPDTTPPIAINESKDEKLRLALSQNKLKEELCDTKKLNPGLVDTPSKEKTIGDTVVININEEILNQAGSLPSGSKISFTKEGENIISILTEKQMDPIIEGRQKKFFVFNMPQHEPVGDPIDYSPDRNGFVRLVLGLVLAMLAVTTGCTIFAYMSEGVQRFMYSVPGLTCVLVCLVVIIVIDYTFCCSGCSSAFPCNIILLIVGTCAYSYVVCFITCRYDKNIVLLAVIVTLAIVVLCFLLAMTSFDFTRFLLIVLVASFAVCFAFIGVGILQFAFGIKLTLLRIILLIVSTLLSCVMLVIELQMILGGKSVELGEEEYAYGAYSVYTSIIDIFLKLLKILNQFIDPADLF